MAIVRCIASGREDAAALSAISAASSGWLPSSIVVASPVATGLVTARVTASASTGTINASRTNFAIEESSGALTPRTRYPMKMFRSSLPAGRSDIDLGFYHDETNRRAIQPGRRRLTRAAARRTIDAEWQ